MLFLSQDSEFSAGGLHVLAVAPDPYLESLGRRSAHNYLSIDLTPGKAMRVMDLTRLDLPAGGCDLVIAFHVLEHIPDDRAAMREIRRVLSVRGRAFIEVPLSGDTTDERYLAADPSVRAEVYGQPDHMRLYGRRDFESRLRNAGLIPESIVVGERFARETVEAGLDADEVFYVVRPAAQELPHGRHWCVEPPAR